MRQKDFGYYDQSLGRFIYNDDQMGNALTDLWGAITGGAGKVVDKAQSDILGDLTRLPDAAKDKIISQFLDTGTGQAVVADAKQSWLQQQQDKIKTVYVQNKTAINTGMMVVAGLAVAYIVLRKPERRASAVQYIPFMPQTPAAPAAPAAAANPRRRRRKHSRKHARRRK